MGKQFGEIVRRTAFNGLDRLHGGKLNRIKAANKKMIVKGVSKKYVRVHLYRILRYARENSEFYRKEAKGNRLTDFPVMNKMKFNENRDTVLSDPFIGKENSLFAMSTSGSTGIPFKVLADDEKRDRMNMNFISFMELNGFRMGMKRGEFRAWIKGKNTRSAWTLFKTNLIMIDIANMGDQALAGICRTIEKKRVQALSMYASALPLLVDYITRKEIDVSRWSLEMIFVMGEALTDDCYDKTTEIFGFHPIRSYGNNENGYLACQVGDDPAYVCDLSNFYFEILRLDSDEPAGEGELGRIVVTDFYNKAFPMIRYDTGDTGVYRETVDENGRIHGQIEKLYGRRGSILYNTKGEPLSIHVFMNVLLNLEDTVHQAKCIQWEKNRYEILLNADTDKVDEASVVQSYRNYLGEDANIGVTYVDEIPILASGKRLVCEQKCEEYLG